MQWGGCFVKPNDPMFTVQDVVETAVEVGDDGCCCYLYSRCRASGNGSGWDGEENEEGEGGLLRKHTNKEPDDDGEEDGDNNGQHDSRRQR